MCISSLPALTHLTRSHGPITASSDDLRSLDTRPQVYKSPTSPSPLSLSRSSLLSPPLYSSYPQASTPTPLLYLPWTKFSAGPLLTPAPRSSSALLATSSSASRPYVPLLLLHVRSSYSVTQDMDPVNATTTTTLWRVNKPTKEDRLAKFEWALNGSLGRATLGATLGRVCMRSCDRRWPSPAVHGH